MALGKEEAGELRRKKRHAIASTNEERKPTDTCRFNYTEDEGEELKKIRSSEAATLRNSQFTHKKIKKLFFKKMLP